VWTHCRDPAFQIFTVLSEELREKRIIVLYTGIRQFVFIAYAVKLGNKFKYWGKGWQGNSDIINAKVNCKQWQYNLIAECS